MAALHAARFGAARQPAFARELEGRDAAILVHTQGRLAAFTALTVVEAAWRGQGICALCTGDLVHDGSEAAARAIAMSWMRHAGGTRRRTQFPVYWLLATLDDDFPKTLGDIVKGCYIAGSDPGSEIDLFTNAFARESLRGEDAPDGVRFVMFTLDEANLKPLSKRAFAGADLHDLIAS
ncbi:MAG: hypothetical protein ACM3X5_05300 [Bacillota bacterium]